MKKILGVIILGLLLSGCETTTMTSLEATGYNFANLNKGMSKSAIRNIYKHVGANSDPTFANYCTYEYFSEAKAEILSSSDKSNHLVFEVDQSGSCDNNSGKFHSAHNTYDSAKKILLEKEQMKISNMIDESKNTCKLLGMKEDTDKFSDCALKLYTQKIDIAAKENQKIVSGGMSGNSVTIYDPVRDSEAMIKRGQGLINGTCTLGDLSNC